MRIYLALVGLCAVGFLFPVSGSAQSLGNAGTVEGTVVDQSGAAIAGADVTIHNAISGYSQAAKTAANGSFRLVNIPPNPYHLEVTASGFTAYSQDIAIRNSIPVQVKATLPIAGTKTTVTVEAAGADLLENDPSAHVDVDRSQMLKLPTFDPASLEASLRLVADARSVKAATLIHAVRVAITGKSVSPGLFDVLSLVGRERTRARLAAAIRMISTVRG